MATVTYKTCDRCGSKGGGTWETEIVSFSFQLPIDGVNGGKYQQDLCRPCREAFWKHVNDFDKGATINQSES